MSPILRAAMEIAQKQEKMLSALRSALHSGDDAQALEIARRLCGVRHDEKASHRVN